jgi:CBS domain-containing protein
MHAKIVEKLLPAWRSFQVTSQSSIPNRLAPRRHRKFAKYYLEDGLSMRKARKAIEFADKEFLVLDENTLVAEAAKIMYERDACSVIITKNSGSARLRIPVGIVTSRDMLHRVVAQNKGPFKTTLRDVMSAPLITIGQDSTVDDAVSLMASMDIARLPVIKDDELFAVVSLKSLASAGSRIPAKSRTIISA